MPLLFSLWTTCVAFSALHLMYETEYRKIISSCKWRCFHSGIHMSDETSHTFFFLLTITRTPLLHLGRFCPGIQSCEGQNFLYNYMAWVPYVSGSHCCTVMGKEKGCGVSSRYSSREPLQAQCCLQQSGLHVLATLSGSMQLPQRSI